MQVCVFCLPCFDSETICVPGTIIYFGEVFFASASVIAKRSSQEIRKKRKIALGNRSQRETIICSSFSLVCVESLSS